MSESAADLLDNATDCRYVTIDNSTHRLSDTLAGVQAAIPGIYPRISSD